jgi:uncharacterized protein (TIGR02677 family)
VLQELQQLSQQTRPDAGRVYRELLVLRSLLEDLSATLPNFVASLEGRIDLEPPELRSLIDYGGRFIDELVLEADGIVEAIRDIDAAGFERLLQPVAERSFRESFGATPAAVAGVCNQWRSFWEALRRWFISQPGSPSEAEALRERARAAITALLRLLKNIEDQRSPRVDRASDFRILARWFAQAESDAQAHLLWRSVFGLCPARHLVINDATLDEREARDIPPNTSWRDAPPLQISAGPGNRRGLSRTRELSRIVDRSAEKEKLAAASHAEAQRLLDAQRRFGTGSRIRLSELEHLEPDEFDVLLDLLGEAVSARVFPTDSVEILSADGCSKIKLEPTGDGRGALILTTQGMFSGPDHWISVEPMAVKDVLKVIQ